MNVARKIFEVLKLELIRNLKDLLLFNNFGKIIDEFEEWIEMHEKAFDHSKIKEGMEKEWLEYHDKVMAE